MWCCLSSTMENPSCLTDYLEGPKRFELLRPHPHPPAHTHTHTQITTFEGTFCTTQIRFQELTKLHTILFDINSLVMTPCGVKHVAALSVTSRYKHPENSTVHFVGCVLWFVYRRCTERTKWNSWISSLHFEAWQGVYWNLEILWVWKVSLVHISP